MNRRSVVVAVVLMQGCVQPSSLEPDPVFSVRIVTTYDRDGVGTATCPGGSRIVGGGCSCKGVGDPLFSGSPAGNSYVCGCYHFGTGVEEGVESYVTCLSSTVSSSLSQNLIGAEPRLDPEVERVVSELRKQRASR